MTLRIAFLLSFVLVSLASAAQAERPNVVLIMTDDQGYGDLGCHGNPVVKTPHIDCLYEESVRLTDFHVNSFCTPTRAALMTGRYSSRTGAYRTSSGRTMLHTDETTIANTFRDAGYATGIFGKWHLGDNFPHRPQDRGFQATRWHRCGGVGQASDYWENDYTDDTYEENGQFKKFDGYCTDVWFEGATEFVEANRDRPFFVYIPTNAPHGPYRVPEEYALPYRDKGLWRNGAEFYGMIANLDENVGRLRERLEELELERNTIFIIMTDNGTAQGASFEGLDAIPRAGFNAGMRGKKSSIYDGGHRVPCFIHWPAGGIVGGKDIDALAAHIDLLPTLVDLCGVARPDKKLDGRSLAPLLRGESSEWQDDRTIVMQFQGGAYFAYQPCAWKGSFVMTRQWRLLDGELLFDIKADPTQSENVAADHPEVVQKLREAYLPWWEEVAPRVAEPVCIGLGDDADNPTTLCSQDWYMASGNPPWNFGSILRLPKVSGPWMVEIVQAGTYRITLRQLPVEADQPLREAATARIEIAGCKRQMPVSEGAKGVTFTLDLPKCKTTLKTYLIDDSGAERGAYFTTVERVK